VFTDGLKALYDQSAGREQVQALLRRAAAEGLAAQALADAVLELALAAADGRPRDDVSVLVVAVLDTAEPRQVRRLALQLPV
jgi:serine phosphatase RsbU (regulator of sigma subunit)